ncbi:MAG: [FeFe] hydrogenase, group A [Bacilli bacterium]
MKKYRCKVCGYIHNDEINNEFICPECGATKNNFIDETIDKKVWISEINPSIMRINKKCINCGMCKNICENKTGIKYDPSKVLEPICINCGQCIITCPSGALVPKYDYKKVLEYITDPNYTVIVSTAPSVRVALGDEFDLEPGTLVTGKMINALRKCGFDYVLDTCYGADLTIMEEATELLTRIKNNKNLPQFTSCCPSWVKYCELYHEELLPNLSETKSPISMQGAIIKTYFCEKQGLDPNKVINVTIAPCTAKKYEIKREELQGNDFVLTTSELAILIREKNLDFKSLMEDKFDNILGEASGSGVIFGNSGGVMEAALRTAFFITEKKNPPLELLNFQNVRGLKEIKEAEVSLGGKTIKVAVIYGMPKLEEILEHLNEYTFIEVMNCPGGCISGGGQPLVPPAKLNEYREKRMASLYYDDASRNVRNSYQNLEIIELYKDYLEHPGSIKAKKILHTKYNSKKDMLETK